METWLEPNGAQLFLYRDTPNSPQNYANSNGLSIQRIAENQRIRFIKDSKYPNYELEKDKFGKPFLSPRNTEINYSHTKDLLFWGEHPNTPIGVDIEYIRPKIGAIFSKFVNAIELDQIQKDDLKMLTKIWSAKESIFKAYGAKEVDFKRDITLLDIGNNLDSTIQARFHKNHEIDLEVSCKWIDDFIMTSVVWNETN